MSEWTCRCPAKSELFKSALNPNARLSCFPLKIRDPSLTSKVRAKPALQKAKTWPVAKKAKTAGEQKVLLKSPGDTGAGCKFWVFPKVRDPFPLVSFWFPFGFSLVSL